MRGGGKLKTGRRKPYMVRLSNKYQMKLERSLKDSSGQVNAFFKKRRQKV